LKDKYYNNGWFGRHPGIYYTFGNFILNPLRIKVARYLDLDVPSHILDVATGTGGQAILFKKLGHTVLGIDLDINMLRKAQQKGTGKQEIPFLHGDGTKLPIKPNTFDLVVISYAMHDVPYIIGLNILEEAKRVVKNAGTICVIDYEEPNNNIAAWILYHIAILYESPNYKPFIQERFQKYLTHTQLKIGKKVHLAYGAVRVMCLKKT
jgi:ubiquinone/menaquinone biosynthesis C-methylase UbiE